MATNWTNQWSFAGYRGGRVSTYTFTPTNPMLEDNYRRITAFERTTGFYGKAGGSNDTATVGGIDELIDASTGEVIVASPESTESFYGTGMHVYLTTRIDGITPLQSRAILNAWKNGTLQVKRSIYFTRYSSSNREITITSRYGTTITFWGTDSSYLPEITELNVEPLNEERFYAETWSDGQAPFDFSMTTTIAGNEYWESPDRLYRRIEISAENLTNRKVPMETAIYELNESVENGDEMSTTLTVTQENFDFARREGFLRGCRYRIGFTMYIGVDAETITESVDESIEIEVASVPLHLSRLGRGVAIGQYSSIVEVDEDGNETDNMLFECRYPAKLYGGILEGGYVYTEAEGGTDESKTTNEMIVGTWIDGSPIYRYVLIKTNITTTKDHVIGTMPAIPQLILGVNGCWKDDEGRFYPISFSASEDGSGWNGGVRIEPTDTGANIWAFIGTSLGNTECVVIIDYVKAPVATASEEETE